MNIPPITATLTSEQLWAYIEKALDGGDFSWLEKLLNSQNTSIIELLASNPHSGKYDDESFTWACFVGRTADAEALLDKGVDPAAGIATGLAGFHWAVNRGNPEIVRMLIKRGTPLEQKNMYGGTVLGCALWSAVYEHRESHGEIIKALIEAGAEIEPGTLRWWEAQDVPSVETKRQVASVLRESEKGSQ